MLKIPVIDVTIQGNPTHTHGGAQRTTAKLSGTKKFYILNYYENLTQISNYVGIRTSFDFAF